LSLQRLWYDTKVEQETGQFLIAAAIFLFEYTVCIVSDIVSLYFMYDFGKKYASVVS